MEREIKFRVYDTKLCVMYSPDDQIGNLWSIKDSPNGVLNYEDGELMQYTGLKDKNGVEIYEGDIKLWKFNNHRWIFICYWSEIDSGFRWKLAVHNEKQSDDMDFPFDTEEDYYNYMIKSNQRNNGFDSFSEIIGNIHENPELLDSN